MRFDDRKTGPLSDLLVIELSSAIAGPFAGKLLSENGADVIKVEPPWGDGFRTRDYWYDEHDREDLTYRFLEYNTGKLGVSIDLRTDDGKTILWELIEAADVLIANMRAGVMDRLGFDWESIRDRNGTVVYCSITGYGDDGPYADRAAYDPVVQGVSSWVQRIGTAENPRIMDLWIIDHATAMYAVSGILLGLLDRTSTGAGTRIDLSMLDVAVSFLGHPFAEYSATEAHDLEPIYRTGIEPQGVFEVADGRMGVIVVDEAWEEFCRAIDRPELIEDDRFASADARVDHVTALHAEVNAALRERSETAWVERFQAEAPGVITGPVNRFRDLPSDPQVRHRELFLERDHPVLGPYYLPRPALTAATWEPTITEAPTLGEDTDTVLAALGYEPSEIDELRQAGVLG